MAGGSGVFRVVAFLALAVASGSAALVGIYALIVGYQAEIARLERPEDTVMVIVASRDLFQGVTITEEDLYAVQIPPRYLPEGVFLSPEHVVGRIPRERVLANEFVRAKRLADPESGQGLHAVLPRGLRAISVGVGDGAALSGFLSPGSYVDVLVTLTPEAGTGEAVPRTHTLLQAVFVLGVNGRMRGESVEQARALRGRAASSVTLLVTAEQAERVAHAENIGEIVLSLRGETDTAGVVLEGVDLDDLRSKLALPEVDRSPRPIAPRCRVLENISGPNKNNELFDEDGFPCE